CARGVDERIRGVGVDHVDPGAARDDRASLTASQRRYLALSADALERGVEIVDSIEGADLRFVGHQDVDMVLDEIEKCLAMSIDAEWIGQRERDLSARRVRQARRFAERLLG